MANIRPEKASNTVGKLLSKLKNKNRLLSTDNMFVINVTTKDESSEEIGKYSIYSDKFIFQLFNLESDVYTVGFQDISYIKGVNISDTFTISMKENPDATITKLIYNHLFSLIKSNKSRILNDNSNLFDEVFVYHFLDTINKHNGNHYVYKFTDVKLYKLDNNDANLNFEGVGLVDKELTLKFNAVDIMYYDIDNKQVTTHSIDLINDKFTKGEPIEYV